MKQGQFLFEHIKINGQREVTKITRIYTASIDGWRSTDFHEHCDGKGPTLCLIRSSDKYLAAGFTSIAWASGYGTDVEDASAMVFALTHDLQVFKTKNSEKAVWHHRRCGPYW